MGFLFAAMSTVGWGTGNYVAGIGALTVPPREGVALSLYAGLLWVLLLALVIAGTAWRVSLGGFLAFAGIGILNFPISRGLLYRANRDIGPSRAMALRGFSAVFAVILSALTGELVPPLPVLGAMLLVIAGVVLLGLEQSRDFQRDVRMRGIVMGLVAATGFGCVPVIVRLALPLVGSPLEGVAVAVAVGAFVQTFLTYGPRLLGRQAEAETAPTLEDSRKQRAGRGAYALSGIFSGSANVTNYVAVSYIAPSIVAALVSATPFVTLVASRIFRRHNERLTPRLYAAGFLIVCGGALISLLVQAG